MYIAGIYSFNKGKDYIDKKYSQLYKEIEFVIESVIASEHKTKISKEKTMKDKVLYNPRSLNTAFKNKFFEYGWIPHKEHCNYPTKYYTNAYKGKYDNQNDNSFRNAFREMDFVKQKLGIEVQFGKYAFMVYNVCAKMTIFNKKGIIDAGVEIVPIKKLAGEMSTGVSYFEQFVWDLENRGISNIDIPVLILGVDDIN